MYAIYGTLVVFETEIHPEAVCLCLAPVGNAINTMMAVEVEGGTAGVTGAVVKILYD